MISNQRTVRRGRPFPELQWTDEQKAEHKAKQLQFYQRCWEIFLPLQSNLMSKYYGWYIAIEPDSGYYIIEPNQEVATKKMRKKYPDTLHHIFGINETAISGEL